MILPPRIFAAKHSGMGNRKHKWWQGVPWGWVSVTAYATVLICAAFSQAMEPGGAALIVKDYQTLIAGLATMAALLIAAEQLKRQANRDRLDAVRHHETELVAIRNLDRAAVQIGNSIGYRSTITMDKAWWARLAQEVTGSLGPAMADVARAVEEHNAVIDPPGRPFISLWQPDDRQLRNAELAVRRACISLQGQLQTRKNAIGRLVEAAA